MISARPYAGTSPAFVAWGLQRRRTKARPQAEIMRACSQARKNVDRGRKSLVPLLWLFWSSSYMRKGDKMTFTGKNKFYLRLLD